MAIGKNTGGEVTGAVDLISHFNLSAQYDYFCLAPLPSIEKSVYLEDVVGKTEIDKENGRLGQLIMPNRETKKFQIQPFDQNLLRAALRFKEADPAPSEKGIPTMSGKPESESKDKEKAAFRLREAAPVALKGIPTISGKLNSELNKQHQHEIEKKRKYDGDEGVGDIYTQKKIKFRIKR